MTDSRDVQERIRGTASGIVMFLVFFFGGGGLALFLASSGITLLDQNNNWGGLLFAAALLTGAVSVFCMLGLFTIQPNQAAALTLFGKYVGTVRQQGLRWANPLLTKHKISLRVRNFDSEKLKVNELDGSPVEIAAIVVWRVVDSARALFGVDSYQNFVEIQAESAIRQMATSYPYDGHDDRTIVALRSHSEEISERLEQEIQSRLAEAGVEVLEAKISHLAYAPEIASAMLQRQQAGAVVAARAQIVAGAVGMVEATLAELSGKGILDLDPERRAAMASNLLVVLCGDRSPTPVVNAGSLY
jgi:regulator of protease activity HflC (stomatin/prohibitin superfamily)